MLRSPAVSLPVAEPLALTDATLLFLVQVLLAMHPELYAPPESGTEPRPPPRTRAAHHIIDPVRAVHNAIKIYSADLTRSPPTAPLTTRFRFDPTPAREDGDPADRAIRLSHRLASTTA
ncbi:hypothetical protein WME98_24030 [Sorangium sp. So ce296]|uniref:hypothetical protein n=1 Tax=Sorangium sp. So ce296 TaxID=3133296 RepID=UPI003F5EFDEE